MDLVDGFLVEDQNQVSSNVKRMDSLFIFGFVIYLYNLVLWIKWVGMEPWRGCAP